MLECFFSRNYLFPTDSNQQMQKNEVGLSILWEWKKVCQSGRYSSLLFLHYWRSSYCSWRKKSQSRSLAIILAERLNTHHKHWPMSSRPQERIFTLENYGLSPSYYHFILSLSHVYTPASNNLKTFLNF